MNDGFVRMRIDYLVFMALQSVAALLWIVGCGYACWTAVDELRAGGLNLLGMVQLVAGLGLLAAGFWLAEGLWPYAPLAVRVTDLGLELRYVCWRRSVVWADIEGVRHTSERLGRHRGMVVVPRQGRGRNILISSDAFSAHMERLRREIEGGVARHRSSGGRVSTTA